MIQNQASFDYNDLLVIFGEENLINIPTSISTNDVVIDSRLVKKGSIFVALKGEKLDAHEKVVDAINSGASICIISQDWYDKNKSNIQNNCLIKVSDTLAALGKLATYHRNRFSYPIIAVAGSNGKTSTKEMIACVLSEKYKVLKTYENFNNLLGVPLMLLSMNEKYDVVVLELGTNQPGEMFELGKICRPDNVLITNIGKEHLEFLIDIDGVEMEETSILGEVRAGGFAFINYDDERLKRYGHILDKFLTYGTDKEAGVVAEIKLDDNLQATLNLKYEERELTVNLKTFGIGSAKNAIAAAALAFKFELSDEEIKRGLEKFQPLLSKSYGRMAVENYGNFTIINDCYNANPSSMELALENLKLMKSDRTKVAVLGDMRELGETALEEHHLIIEMASKIADIVCLYGDEMDNAFEMFEFDSNVTVFQNKDDIANFLDNIVGDGLIVLVKGSRGMRMEEVIENLRPV